ncbi:Acidic leucine-rich nuclear phosphoprotein 32 like protein, partial [Aduncisulcus paluster]
DELRTYLSDETNSCLTADDIETNGIISVATLRSALTCTSLSLSDIVSYSSNISDVTELTTLQGLEYATSLTSLTLDGYDLSGDTNSNAEYDKLVVQILAKAVSYSNDYGSIDSGLTSLSVSGCGLSEVSDVLDLTPIASADTLTQVFKLATLDLSDNSISDVSVLITEDIFPADTLATLDISGNNICDIDGMVDELETYFSATSIAITYSDQTCNCTMRITSASHEVCREVYPDRWDVECWKGYYYDVDNESCVEATATEDILRCQVCERNSKTRPVLESGASAITCGCRSAWYGDDCESLYQVHVPSLWLRKGMCYYLGYELTLCDFSEFEAAGYSDSVSNSDGFASITTPEGLHYMINVSNVTLFNISPVSALEFSLMPQLTSLLYLDNFPSVHDFEVYDYPTPTMHRLSTLAIRGSNLLYDISMFYRNIKIVSFGLADTSLSTYTVYCRSEDDDTFLDYITNIFGRLTSDYATDYAIPNACSINDTDVYYCSSDTECPSIVINEVYNHFLSQKECSTISKEGDSGECYTIHDDTVRSYLTTNCGVTAETNGVISVASLRSGMTCTSLTLTDISADVTAITSLQGLEYTQGLDTDGNVVGLTALNLDGYDLSGDSDVSEYDQIVVQILAKGDTFSNRNSVSVDIGLTSLSASGCGLKYISDVLDLTPIASADSLTQPFMLSTLDLSDNSISDVSLFISDDIFPADTLTTLDISGNYICDVDNVSSALTSSISTLSTLTINDQNSCACGFNSLSSSAIAFSEHRTCRRRSDGHYQVECW